MIALPLQLAITLWGLAVPVYASAVDHRLAGLALRAEERFPEAIAEFEKAIALEPNQSSNYVLLGWTQHLYGQSESAAHSLWQAIYLQPQQVEAYNALGIVYLVRGDLPQAILIHSWSALLKPDNEIAYFNLSLAYHRQQMYDLALYYARSASVLEPNNPHPLIAQALAYWGKQDQASALQALRQGIALQPLYGNPQSLDQLKKAGFHPTQIATVSNMLNRMTIGLIDGNVRFSH